MHRRRFIAATVAGAVGVPALSSIAQTPAAEDGALDVALARYLASDDSGIRSIVARVSMWRSEDDAVAFQEFLAGRAGSDLPEGEFYESEPEEWSLPDLPDDVTATAMEWHTVIGFAAYRTEWGLFIMRHGAMLWDFWISGAERDQVRDQGLLMMTAVLGYTAPECWQGAAGGFLPQPEAIPEGMERVEGEVADDDLDFPVVPSIATPQAVATLAVPACGSPES